MKRLRSGFLFMILLFFISGCTGGSQQIASYNGFAVLPELKPGEAVATFAGGCFWAMQESMLQLKGVNTVISGYAGGTAVNPTYEEVLQKNTGHAETVQVYYNPSVITYEQLALAFFYAHDPTQVNRQGPDIGSDYRSVAFFRSPQELKTLGKLIHQLTAERYYRDVIVTSLEPFEQFYPAESSHQDYYQKNRWDPYIRNVSRPKVEHVRTELPDLIKPEYQN